MGLVKTLSFWVLYFAPTLIAWYRSRNGQPILSSVGKIFLFDLLLGWTVVGWFLVLANAFGQNPVAWFVLRFGKYLTTPAPGMGAQQGRMPSGSSSAAACGQCGGSGSTMCSSCGGRGSWYSPPTGESGVAQLQTCGACTSSGRLRCAYCGGSGRVPGYA